MKKNKNIAAKILAFVALIAILFSIISVGLSIYLGSSSSQNIQLTPEDLESLENVIGNDDSFSPEDILEIKENIIENTENIDEIDNNLENISN